VASNYPGSLDSFDTIASDKKTSDAVGGRTHRQMHNDLGDAIEAVQGELGTDPAGVNSTVAARLDAVESGVNLGDVLAPKRGTTGAGPLTWAASAATVTAYADEQMSGAAALKLVSTGTSNFGAYVPGTGTNGQPVEPGIDYSVAIGLKAPSITRSVNLYIYWYKADGSASSTPFVTYSIAALSTSEQMMRLTSTAPNDAAFGAIRVAVQSPAAAGEEAHVSFWRGVSGIWTTPQIPTATTDNALARFDGTAGFLQNSGVTVDDSANVTTAGNVSAATPTAAGHLTTKSWVEGQVSGGDAVMTVGASQDFTDWPCGLQVEWQTVTTGLGRQQYRVKIDGVSAQLAADELAPIRFPDGGYSVWRGGNHGPLVWSAATSLTTADEGKTWASGSDRITLLKVSGGVAYWSLIHDASLTTLTSSAPAGTWTLASNPDQTFSSPTLTQLKEFDTVATSTRNWENGRWQRAQLILSQAIPTEIDIIAAAQSLGRQPLPADLTDPAITLHTVWTVLGEQPGNVFVDVAAEIHDDVTITEWGGLQMTTWGQNAIIGVDPGHALETWAAPGVSYALPADWADATPPSAMASRRTTSPYGSGLLAVLDSGQDRSDLDQACWTSAANKMYLDAYDPGLGEQSAGSVLWVSGVRSFSAETTDRHIWFATDGTGVTRWWLVAGSTGVTGTAHPMMMRLLGRRLVKSRGTAALGQSITPAGVEVTTAGWAQGTVT